MKKKNISLEEKYEDFWIYILLLTTLVIFISSLKSYTFTLLGVELTFAVLFLPFVYLIVFTKKVYSNRLNRHSL